MVEKPRKNLSFFLVISIVGLFTVLIGFAKTFFLPVAAGTFSAPPAIHIHAAFAFAWILLFVLQTSLIHFHKYFIHQTLGVLGLVVAIGIAITMIPAGIYVVDRDLVQGAGPAAFSSILGIITSAILFLFLVVAGLLHRNKREYHKRYMLLATIVVLWPAWFRFRHYFPSVPRPEIWFALVLADSLIVVSWVWDKISNGMVHPVLKYMGLFIILEQSFEVIVFDNPTWRVVAKSIYLTLKN